MFLKMNDAAVDLIGFNNKTEDVNLMHIAHPDEKHRILSSFKQLLEKGSLTNFEVSILTTNKTRKLVQVNSSIIYNNGKPIAAQGIARDITEDKASESKLIESEERLAALILNLDTAILVEDQNKKIVLVNNKFCELFNIPVSPEQMIGTDCSNSSEETKHLFENPDKFVEDIKKILLNKKTILSEELRMKNGKILERDFITILRNDTYYGHLWSYRDITLQKKLRAEH